VIHGTFTMSGGSISGNTASIGGGVNVSHSPGITKTGGSVIYGSNGGTLKNTATRGDTYGHAVFVEGSSPQKKRNTTAGAGVNLDSSYSGTIPGGGWE
jgi:hypothetical protein